jgi:hypothetical protein
VASNNPVIAWTPYGREETVSILARYMFREHSRGVIDQWWLCLNTDPGQAEDTRYAYMLAAAYPEWIKLKERPEGRPRRTPKQRNTGYFYEYMTDRDTVFIRIDDDIVYLHPQAINRLVAHRLQATTGVASFPVMWNNSIISWYAQQAGVIPAPGTRMLINLESFRDWVRMTEEELNQPPRTETYDWPKVGGPYCMDAVGWADGRFAVALHRLLIDRVEAGRAEDLFLYQDYQLQTGMQFSVSVFASLGSLYADLPDGPGVLVPYEEEHWHTVHQPSVIGSPNSIVGDALVSHYTFFPQGPVVRATDILDRYRSLADKECSR